MQESEYDIDVAISSTNDDLELATELRQKLGSSLEVFVYTANQEELAGTDGLQSLRKVFRHRARLVVILYRGRWGQTPWTRVEEDAITDRFLKEGANFLFVIMLDTSPPPPWLPDKLIRFDLKEFGIEQAVGAIKVRALERGSSIHRPSTAFLATQAQEVAEFGKRRSQLMRSEAGVTQALAEACEFLELLCERAKEAQTAAPNLEVEYGAAAEWCVVRTGDVAIHASYQNRIINVLDEARLFVREYRGAVILPGQNAYYIYEPRELSKTILQPELTRAQGWC